MQPQEHLKTGVNSSKQREIETWGGCRILLVINNITNCTYFLFLVQTWLSYQETISHSLCLDNISNYVYSTQPTMTEEAGANVNVRSQGVLTQQE